jgi:hypothetical protein
MGYAGAMGRAARLATEVAIARGGALGLVMLACYVALAPAHVVDGDNAEFAALGAVGGGAHPSGYPGYVLWLRALAWLPAASPAHAAAIATALLAALQIVVLHAACRAWGARPVAATVATAVFAASPLALRYGSEAEAFAFNGLVVACVLWLAAAAGPLRGWRRAAALGLVAGLGLSGHLTCALVAPVGVLGALRGVREARRPGAAAGAAVVALGVGLLPYAYLFAAPDTVASWAHPHDLGDLLAIFLRREYSGAAGLTGAGGPVDVAGHLRLLAGTLLRTWLWLLAPLGLAAIAYCAARGARRPADAGAGTAVSGTAGPGAGEPRAGWIALGASWLVAGPLLVLRFDLPVGDFGIYAVERFHLLPALLLVVPVAAALDVLWRVALPRATMTAAAGTIVALVGAVALVAIALPALAAARPRALEAGVHNMLRTMPPRAVILGHGDTLDTATRYAQLALGERPDVNFVHWTALPTSWYRAKIAAAGLAVPVGPGAAVALARQLFAEGRPLFVDQTHEPVGELARVFKLAPYGFLMRVIPEGTRAPSLDEVVRDNQALFARFDLDYPRPSVHQIHAAAMNQRYERTWRTLAQALAASGDRDGAAGAAAIAEQLAPTDD